MFSAEATDGRDRPAGGKALWEDGNICAGRQAHVTTNVPAASICAGDFTKMRFATWGAGSPVAVIIDLFKGKKEGKIEITNRLK